MKYFLPVILYLFSATGVLAQFEVRTHLDLGNNNVSDGVFLKNGFHGSYGFDRYRVEAGMQFDYLSSNPNALSGLDIAGTGTFSIRSFLFDIKGFFILNWFSDLMFETNWGVRTGTSALQHFRFELGTFFRTYTINAESREE